jgi:DNA-binding GntR family transcriptional regulator
MARTPVASLDSRSVVAYRAIKAEILANRLQAGEHLPIDRFVRELGVSRTPLREAVQQLEKEGFVEIRPRMGTFVSHLNLREIREMYEVRQALEGYAARLAAERVGAGELQAVEAALRRHTPTGAVDLPAMSEDGQRLHRLIIDSCGNGMLTGMLRALQDHFTRFRVLSLELPEKILSSHQEHLAIVEALRACDGALAERVVREHFAHAGQTLLESLLGNAGGPVSGNVLVGEQRPALP